MMRPSLPILVRGRLRIQRRAENHSPAAVAGDDGDVLHAVHRVGHGRRHHGTAERDRGQFLAAVGRVGVEVAVGVALEHEAAGGGEHPAIEARRSRRLPQHPMLGDAPGTQEPARSGIGLQTPLELRQRRHLAVQRAHVFRVVHLRGHRRRRELPLHESRPPAARLQNDVARFDRRQEGDCRAPGRKPSVATHGRRPRSGNTSAGPRS